VEQLLPVWAHPHTSWRLAEDDWPRPQFTFGLALLEVASLVTAERVGRFGRIWGFEWLVGLSAGVHQETKTALPASELALFLAERHGIVGPREVNSVYALNEPPAGLPPDEVLEQYATEHGRTIRAWAVNAFSGVEARLSGWARAREPIPTGYQAAASRRLKLTEMPAQLVSVNTIDGRLHWTRGYTTLHERVALELEDLAVRRPRPRICALCERPYIPLRPNQRVCATNLWDASSRRTIERCTPTSDTERYDEAAARLYKTARKTQWARMNRVRTAHGASDPRTHEAIREWEKWQEANPSPRPRGRPRGADAMIDATALPPEAPAGPTRTP
jgi:hypothetical protein